MGAVPHAILFDADEVLQTWKGDHRQLFSALIGDGADVDRFVDEIFAAEAPCLTGHGQLEACLAPVLLRWGSAATVADVLALFTMVEADPDIVELVRTLRHRGVRCYLASNQQIHRASFMSDALGYAQLFDAAFYSCHVGAKKPDPAYFAAVVAQLGLEPGQIAFFDDLAENVAAARGAGLRAFQFHIAWGAAHLRALLADLGALPSDAAMGGEMHTQGP